MHEYSQNCLTKFNFVYFLKQDVCIKKKISEATLELLLRHRLCVLQSCSRLVLTFAVSTWLSCRSACIDLAYYVNIYNGIFNSAKCFGWNRFTSESCSVVISLLAILQSLQSVVQILHPNYTTKLVPSSFDSSVKPNSPVSSLNSARIALNGLWVHSWWVRVFLSHAAASMEFAPPRSNPD